MSEKLKPNFTPVPNILFDEAMRTMAPGAVKVLFAICRFTFGWGKPDGDRISLTQLQDITGMARGSVARSFKQLGNLVCIKSGDPSHQQASEYRLNVDIPDVDLVSLRDQHLVSKRHQASLLASLPGETFQRKPKKEDKNGAKAPMPSFADPSGAESSKKERVRATTKRPTAIPPELQPIVFRVIGRMNELAGTSYKPESKIVFNGLVPRLRDGKSEADCIAVVESRWNDWREKSEMRQYFNPETLFRETNFEKYLNGARMARRGGNGGRSAGGFAA
jgi:uncharacterized phage protein (TIGR02220 family)